MRRAINTEHIEGRIYQHNLTIKKVQNQNSENFGKDFISGKLEIATDENGLNVLPVHFTYVTETTKKGAKNNTFTSLKKIIDEGKSWVTSGKDEATKVSVDGTAMALNDFYSQDNTLVSAKRNEGGFVNLVSELKDNESERNTFIADIVITNTINIEPDEERGIKDNYLSVKGVIFNFRNDILPFDFVVKKLDGINYFESLGASPSNPVYTKIWGNIVCSTIVIPHMEETAFGEPVVTNSTRTTKEWVITKAARVPYEFGDEERKDLTTAMQNREVYLADVKKRSDEYRASQNAAPASAPNMATTSISQGIFNF